MANTTIQALIGFSDGVISLGVGDIASVEDTKANAFISAGLAEEYTGGITPSGNISISANGTYDANGGTGTVSAATAIKGNAISLDDGSGLTPPSDKEFKGWATTDSAETPDVTSPYTVSDDVTLYAVYGATE